MRTCMYCGRELKQDEVCNCSGAESHRARKQGDNKKSREHENPYRTETSYRTGYAGKDSKFERARTRYRTKKAARRNTSDKEGFLRYIKSALKSPADTVASPPHIGKAAMLIIAAVTGAALWLCMFFILKGGSVRLTRLIAGVMGFGGSEGLKLAAAVPAVILIGAAGGIMLFFMYMGVFWLINRFIMRLHTPFWEFSIRLVTAWIPFCVICIFGALISILSPVTIVVLLVCGGIVTAALTYDALKTEWISQPAGKVLYAMLLGYFVLFAFISHLIFI